MKKGNLLLTVIVFLLFLSCSNEDDKQLKASALSIKSVYSISPKTYTESSNMENEIAEFDSFWCAGNDIKWYNATTGELKFNITPPPIQGFPPYNYQYLVVFLDDKELIRFETVTSISSIATAHPCILDDIDGLGFYYICKGYPWNPKDGNDSSNSDAEREKNWKAIEPEWNIFIEQLKKEGRYKE
ncbi:hypothetical protein LJC72_13805 [Bacteroides sp. OttesenSCG-928-D19]|nr:hypothetical protein [Bacteroides sp. OttesenSCG-928-D19]